MMPSAPHTRLVPAVPVFAALILDLRSVTWYVRDGQRYSPITHNQARVLLNCNVSYQVR
jgi:hypothetical protein